MVSAVSVVAGLSAVVGASVVVGTLVTKSAVVVSSTVVVGSGVVVVVGVVTVTSPVSTPGGRLSSTTVPWCELLQMPLAGDGMLLSSVKEKAGKPELMSVFAAERNDRDKRQ